VSGLHQAAFRQSIDWKAVGRKAKDVNLGMLIIRSLALGRISNGPPGAICRDAMKQTPAALSH
jgi:hypothetical protein